MILAATVGVLRGAEPAALCEFGGPAMGATYRVKYWLRDDADGSASPAEFQRDADEVLATLDRQMSTWRDDSELSRFNRAPAGEWFAVSADTVTVVKHALALHQASGGAYDVTVGPLSRVWGFGPGKSSHEKPSEIAPPSAKALADARAIVGSQYLEVRAKPPALRKSRAGVEVDLSSLAPGYAVDLIGDALAKRGVRDWLIDVGGEMKARGTKPDGQPWAVGVENPASGAAEPLKVKLSDMAIATSGDYRNYTIVGGRKVAHIIDQRAGQALPVRGFAVSIAAKTCMEADATATAAVVLGPDAGYAWCSEHGVAALFQLRGAAPGETLARRTTHWRQIMGD